MTQSKAVAALGAFARAQKEETRRRLLAAAAAVFGEAGYIATSVDDIAQRAGVSRQTFYRHFDDKLALATVYFNERRANSLPGWRLIGDPDAQEQASVERWLEALFDRYAGMHPDTRAFVEMGLMEPSFSIEIRMLAVEVIQVLSERIAAFATTQGDDPAARARWADAWLLIQAIMEQATSSATGFTIVERARIVPALARSFVHFTRVNAPPA